MQRSAAAPSRGKLIFLVTEDWFFWSHRLAMARVAQEAGFDVAVATRVAAHGERIRGAGFALHPLRWRRRSLGPLASLAAIGEIYRLYRRERPLMVLHVALKPGFLGGIAAALARVPLVVTVVTGMGYISSAAGAKARLIGWVARRAAPLVLLRRRARVVVENADDRDALAALRPGSFERITVFSSSGVDLDRFRVAPEPPPPIVAAYCGRMIAIKGVACLVAAQQRVRRRGIDLQLVLAGAPDPENPTSIPAAILEGWQALPGVRWLGHQSDVRGVWAQAHIAVLASRGGEGSPLTLIEVAAMGRPIIATDVPGNRDIALAGENALLVPPDDEAALADALAALAEDAGARGRLAAAGRRLVEARFSDRIVAANTAELYRVLVGGLGRVAG